MQKKISLSPLGAARKASVLQFASPPSKVKATVRPKSWPLFWKKLAPRLAPENETQQKLQEPRAHKTRPPDPHFFFQGGVSQTSRRFAL